MNAKSRSVLITGGAGVGKSRLLASIQILAAREDFHIVQTANICQPESVEKGTFKKEFQDWQDSISSRAKSSTKKYLFVLVSPTFLSLCDATAFDMAICLRASKEQQLERLRARGVRDEQIEDMLKSQTPVEELVKPKGGYILDTSNMIEGGAVYQEHLASIWARIKGPY